MPQPKKLAIVKDPQDPQPTEVMERAIADIAEGTRRVLGGRLNERAVVVLLKDACGVPMATIEKVLGAAKNLDKTYLRAAVVLLVVGLAGCASAPKKPVACYGTPSWLVPQADGSSIEIYACFGPENAVLYNAKVKPKPAPAPAPAPAAAAAPAPAPTPARKKK